MTKRELINKIKLKFKTGTKFFKWLGYKNPAASWYQFKNNDRIDSAIVRVLEQIDEFEKLERKIKELLR
jgi:hypothetical protein